MIATVTQQRSETPIQEWTLEELADGINVRLKRNATDAWEIGLMFCLAKKKIGARNGFTQWKRDHKWSDGMVARYMRLHEAYESPEGLGDMGIYQALEKQGIVKPRKKTNTAATDESGFPAWAQQDDFDEPESSIITMIEELSLTIGDVLSQGTDECLAVLEETPDATKQIAALILQLEALLMVSEPANPKPR